MVVLLPIIGPFIQMVGGRSEYFDPGPLTERPTRFASLMLYKKQFGPKNFVSFEIIER